MPSYYPQPLSAFAETVREHEQVFYSTFPAAKLSAQGGIGGYPESSSFSRPVSFVFDPHPTAFESGVSSDGGCVAVGPFLDTPAAPEAAHTSYGTVQVSIAGLHYNYDALPPNTWQQQLFVPNFRHQTLPPTQPQPQVLYPSTTSFLSHPEVQSATTTTLPPHWQLKSFSPAQQNINPGPEQRQHPVVVPEYPYTLLHVQSHPQVSLPRQHYAVAAPSSQPYIIHSPVKTFVSSPLTYYPDTPSDLGSLPRNKIDAQEPIVRPRHSLYPVNRALKAGFIRRYPTDDAHVTPPLPPATSIAANAAASSSSAASAASAGSTPSAAGPLRTSRPRQHDVHHTHSHSLLHPPRHARSLSHNTSTVPASKKAPLRAMSASSISSDSQLSGGGVVLGGGGSSAVGGSSSSQSSTTPMRLSPLPSSEEKKPRLACLFCRGRKIACRRPLPGTTDNTCKQCQQRKQNCKYPPESRRGMRKKKNEADNEPDTAEELPAGAAANASDAKPVLLPTF